MATEEQACLLPVRIPECRKILHCGTVGPDSRSLQAGNREKRDEDLLKNPIVCHRIGCVPQVVPGIWHEF